MVTIVIFQKNPIYQIQAAYIDLMGIISYTVLIFTSIQTWRQLASFKDSMSQPTLLMHYQLTKVLVAQAILPCIFVFTPMILIFTVSFITASPPQLGLAATMGLTSICAVDPLVTILIFSGYRKTVFCYCCLAKRKLEPNTLSTLRTENVGKRRKVKSTNI
jgi:hypothetical protein